MISITSYPRTNRLINNNAGFKQTMQIFKGTDITGLIEAGDKALNENRLNDALNAYNEAIKKSPDNVVLNKKLAKTYQNLKNYPSALENYKKYLEQNKEDSEVWILLGEVQRQMALYQDAKKSFETALSLDPQNDLAKRSILETENNILSCFSPQRAYQEQLSYAHNNLQTALNMAVNYLTPEYMKDLEDVQIKFGKTASMNGTSNIAQYENSIKTITVSNEYKYAAPQVIAAYLVHESVHAKDKDAYTSIYEEQDAYEVATNFWLKNSNGVKDPEMDYAVELYKQSPEKLRNRVAEIYTLRDPDIAQTSPNHPPEKKFNFNLKKSKAANQPIKEYSAIA